MLGGGDNCREFFKIRQRFEATNGRKTNTIGKVGNNL